MRWVLLFLLGLFLFGTVSAIDAKTTFTVGGCSFTDDDGDTVNVLKGACSSGVETAGLFYCSIDADPWETLSQGKGCSLGQDTYTLGSGSCCPAGYWCNETFSGSTLFQCQPRLVSCLDQSTEGDCDANDCIWLDESLICVDSLDDLSCGYYTTQTDCDSDDYNLAQTGVGSEILGTNIECGGEAFSILASESKCSWDEDAQDGQKCHINYTAQQSVTSDPTTAAKFSCSNIYSLTPCVDGIQQVIWTSSNSSSGFTDGVPEECLVALNCAGGEDERFCGEPPIKLPGFSLFALFASLSIIGIFYYIKEKQPLNKRMF